MRVVAGRTGVKSAPKLQSTSRRGFAKRVIEEIDEVEVEELDPVERAKELRQMLKRYVALQSHREKIRVFYFCLFPQGLR